MKRVKPVVGHLVAYPEIVEAGKSPVRGRRAAGVGVVIDTPGIWLEVLGPDGHVYRNIRRDSVEVIQ